MISSLLVHHSIEEVHRVALNDGTTSLTNAKVQTVIEKVYSNLLCKHTVSPDMPLMCEQAANQVWNYVSQNLVEMQHIEEIEVDVPIEKDTYVLTGRIDVLRKHNGVLELLDFKTDYRPEPDDPRLVDYERQLCIYASVLEKRHGIRPERLILYWTKESRREDAVMAFRYSPEMVERVGHSIDSIVASITEKKFRITTPPEKDGVCRGCDIQHTCMSEGIVKPFVKGNDFKHLRM